MVIVYITMAFGACLFFYMLYNAFRNNVKNQTLYFRNLPEEFDGFKVLFISDIHRRRVTHRLISKISSSPDAVLIGGDMTEKGVPASRTRENVKRLSEIGPLYFVLGNNDYEVDTLELTAMLEEHGVSVLQNSSVVLTSETGKSLAVVGVDEMKFRKDNLSLALKGSGEADFRILLCHNPDIVKKVKADDSIHLILSGHTHGGQIRIFGFGPYEAGGIKKANGLITLISNGYGTTQLPLRLGAHPEVHMITLKKGCDK